MRSRHKPPISKLALRMFSSYAHMYLGRHLHAIRVVSGSTPGSLDGWPIIVCMNHPSWWDPLVALALAKATFKERSHYAPIDSAALSKYPIFKQFGFFGIERATVKGSRDFLQVGSAILADSTSALWVTGEGVFTDVRTRPVTLRNGIGHLVHSVGRVALVPLAVEYTFWEERSPEVLVCWGQPTLIATGFRKRPTHWKDLAARAVEQAMDRVAELSKHREKQSFDVLLSGSSGIGGIYDFWRGLRARAAGRPFEGRHGSEEL